jgi:hypothetical protein
MHPRLRHLVVHAAGAGADHGALAGGQVTAMQVAKAATSDPALGSG